MLAHKKETAAGRGHRSMCFGDAGAAPMRYFDVFLQAAIRGPSAFASAALGRTPGQQPGGSIGLAAWGPRPRRHPQPPPCRCRTAGFRAVARWGHRGMGFAQENCNLKNSQAAARKGRRSVCFGGAGGFSPPHPQRASINSWAAARREASAYVLRRRSSCAPTPQQNFFTCLQCAFTKLLP